MATIDQQMDDMVGRGLSKESGAASLVDILNGIVDDLTALRAAHLALTAKLDGEDVTNLDTDYAATTDPAALVTVKGS